MKCMCGTALALAVAFLAASEGFSAAPAVGNKDGKKRGKVFTGIVSEVKHGKGKDHGSITVRGHDHAQKGKGQKASAGKSSARLGKGKKQGQDQGDKTTVTFHVGPKTLFLVSGGKGGTHVTHLNRIKEGAHVAIEHHGHHAEEVRMQLKGAGSGNPKAKNKKK